MQSSSTEMTLADCLEIEKRCVGLNLRRADRVVSQFFNDALRGTGLKNTQFSLLVTIRAMQPVPLSRVADRINLDRTTLTRNLDLLEEQGLLATEPGSDLRERVISLTKRGTAALMSAYPLWKATQAAIEKSVGEQVILSLIDNLRKVAAAAA